MKLDTQYNQIIKLLHKDYGWNHLNNLPRRYRDLLNDVIKATKKINQKPPKKKYVLYSCAHHFEEDKKGVPRCVKCKKSIGFWMIKEKGK